MQQSYDLTPIQEAVTIGGVQHYLMEADENAALQYRQASLNGVEMAFDDESGTRTTKRMQGVAAVQPLLVSLGLVEVINAAEQKTRAVPIDIIKKWPSRIVKDLFNRIKEISDLDEKMDIAALEKQMGRLQKRIDKLKEDAAKNGLSATTDTSA